MDRTVKIDDEMHGVRVAKPINPLDLPYEQAVPEYRAEKTTSLRDFLAGEFDELDEDNE